MHCPAGNGTDPIWRVLASSDGISSWTPLKPQHSNPNPNPLTNQLWCIDFLTPPTPLIIAHRLPAFLEYLMPLKNWCSIHARWSKSSLKHSICFCGIFSKFKTENYSISFFWSVLIFRLHFWNPCLTLRIIWYGSRAKWNNPRKRLSPFPIPPWSSYWKGSLQVALDYAHQLHLYIYDL